VIAVRELQKRRDVVADDVGADTEVESSNVRHVADYA
jgi:hypothetical protein